MSIKMKGVSREDDMTTLVIREMKNGVLAMRDEA